MTVKAAPRTLQLLSFAAMRNTFVVEEFGNVVNWFHSQVVSAVGNARNSGLLKSSGLVNRDGRLLMSYRITEAGRYRLKELLFFAGEGPDPAAGLEQAADADAPAAQPARASKPATADSPERADVRYAMYPEGALLFEINGVLYEFDQAEADAFFAYTDHVRGLRTPTQGAPDASR